jgi:CBS-domain-containing membrane protein
MASPVITVAPDTALETVSWRLRDRGIGAVPVVDADGVPLGILSAMDVLRGIEDGTNAVDARPGRGRVHPRRRMIAISGLSARDAMTPVVQALTTGATMARAALLMACERVHHVLVLDDRGALVGLVSSLDVARWSATLARRHVAVAR